MCKILYCETYVFHLRDILDPKPLFLSSPSLPPTTPCRRKCCEGFKFVLGQCIPEGREALQHCFWMSVWSVWFTVCSLSLSPWLPPRPQTFGISERRVIVVGCRRPYRSREIVSSSPSTLSDKHNASRSSETLKYFCFWRSSRFLFVRSQGIAVQDWLHCHIVVGFVFWSRSLSRGENNTSYTLFKERL